MKRNWEDNETEFGLADLPRKRQSPATLQRSESFDSSIGSFVPSDMDDNDSEVEDGTDPFEPEPFEPEPFLPLPPLPGLNVCEDSPTEDDDGMVIAFPMTFYESEKSQEKSLASDIRPITEQRTQYDPTKAHALKLPKHIQQFLTKWNHKTHGPLNISLPLHLSSQSSKQLQSFRAANKFVIKALSMVTESVHSGAISWSQTEEVVHNIVLFLVVDVKATFVQHSKHQNDIQPQQDQQDHHQPKTIELSPAEAMPLLLEHLYTLGHRKTMRWDKQHKQREHVKLLPELQKNSLNRLQKLSSEQVQEAVQIISVPDLQQVLESCKRRILTDTPQEQQQPQSGHDVQSNATSLDETKPKDRGESSTAGLWSSLERNEPPAPQPLLQATEEPDLLRHQSSSSSFLLPPPFFYSSSVSSVTSK